MRKLTLLAALLLSAAAMGQAKKAGGGSTFIGGPVPNTIKSSVSASGHALEIPSDAFLCFDGVTCNRYMYNVGSGALTIFSNSGLNIAASGNTQIYNDVVAGAILQNHLKIHGENNPNSPSIIAEGSLTDIDIGLTPKGAGNVVVSTGIKFSDNSVQTTAASGAGYGVFSSRPAAGTAGKIYVCTDCPVALWADNGSSWHPLIGGQVVGTQPKAAASFTAFSQGSTTLTDRNGALHFHMPSGSGSQQVRGYCESLGSNTHFEASFNTNYVGTSTGFPNVAAIAMKESGTGKTLTFAAAADQSSGTYGAGAQNFFLESGIWASATSRSSNAVYKWPLNATHFWLKMRISGSNTLLEIGTDNTNYYTVATIATTGWATTTADQVCLVGVSWSNVESWESDALSYFLG